MVVVGRINVKEDAPPAILADEIKSLDEYGDGNSKNVNGSKDISLREKAQDISEKDASAMIKLRITREHNLEETMLDLERLLLINNGDIPVRIYLPDGRQIASKHGASLSDFFVETLERMLGNENVKMQGISDKEKY